MPNTETQFTLTQNEKNVIENYLNYYYDQNKNCTDQLPFKTQMQLLYDHLTHIKEW
jgi:hypothetical protein